MLTPISIAELKYHRRVYELLDRRPTRDTDAVERIDAWERATGNKLPAALREWYSLADAESVLTQHNGEPAKMLSLEQVLNRFNRDGTARVNEWLVAQEGLTVDALTTNDDPPVITCSRRGPEIYQHHPSFAEYLVHLLWKELFFPPKIALWATVTNATFGPAHLDYLLERYCEFARHGPAEATNPANGRRGIVHIVKIFHPGLRIAVECWGDATSGEHRAHWTVSGDTPEHLERFLRDLFGIFGYMRFCLIGYYQQPRKKEVDELLARLQEEFGAA